jgi:hypothetical protein
MLFHSQFSRIIKIILADRTECGLVTAKFSFCWQIYKNFSSSEVWLCVALMSRRDDWKPLTSWNVGNRLSRDEIIFIANNGSPTNTETKIYKILKLCAITKCVNSTPVQAVTDLIFIRQLIGTKFFRITVIIWLRYSRLSSVITFSEIFGQCFLLAHDSHYNYLH